MRKIVGVAFGMLLGILLWYAVFSAILAAA